MDLYFIIYLIALIVSINLLVSELKRDLMMMQQNSYRIERYRNWLRASDDSTSMMRLAGMIVFFASLVSFARPIVASIMIIVYSVWGFFFLYTRKYKKPLVWTARCKRIYLVSALICVAVIAIVTMLSPGYGMQRIFISSVACVGLYCGSHAVTMLSVWFLKPVERRINNSYINDAKRMLASIPNLKVIGITGSYGKTSTKHYLYRILSEKYETVMTPGSFNTTLGVVRTIREHLQPYTEVFICEMGAKQPNDIKEICDIVKPAVGIVTAVGPQHLESFKTIERVQQTKFELVDSLPQDGMAVLNNDFEFVANRPVENTRVERYAVSNSIQSGYVAEDIVYSSGGTSFAIVCPDGHKICLRTKLVGECNISNLMAAVIVALYLDVPEQKIAYAVEKIEQVEHRLNVKRIPGGITIIDDAFNSNPTGSAMALDVLASMGGGKRIIITPGMIELGNRQEELNRQFGSKIAKSADVAIVVGFYNRDAILKGIRDEKSDMAIYEVETFMQSQQVLGSIAKPGDIVLYENDLPDTFK